MSQDQELLNVAARLAGVQTVDLLNVVRRADGSLVVIIATGQKYVFDPEQIAAQLGSELDAYLQSQFNPPAAEPPPAAPRKSKRAG